MKKWVYGAAAVLLAACADESPDLQSGGGTLPDYAAAKLVNTSTDAVQGSLLVCFDETAIAEIESAQAIATRNETPATRAGIVAVDEVLATLDVRSLRRLFPCNPRTEERTRAAGLHKWYLLDFGEGADLDETAVRLAQVAEVSRLQFNTRMNRMEGSDFRPRALKAAAAAPAEASAARQFNDPYLAMQWNYVNTGRTTSCPTHRSGADINAGEAWALETGNPQVVVAVVDEGVKYTHPDLAANMWINPQEQADGNDTDENGYADDLYGFNFVTHGPISWDITGFDEEGKPAGDSGHGTHIAGTIAAVNNNGTGVCGIAGGSGRNDGVRIMSCQVFSGVDKTSGSAAVIAEAVKYAADNGASIISCSFGFDSGAFMSDQQYEKYNTVEVAAIDYFLEHAESCAAIDGGLAFFAAGNETKKPASYPGAYRDYIAVTAISGDYLPAYYTNYGAGSNIAAPGGDFSIATDRASSAILSTMPSELKDEDGIGDDYGFMQGTSMACPHVSGVAALGLSYALRQGKHFTRKAFETMLLTSVNNIDRYMAGTKQVGSSLTLTLKDYRKQMGTGTIDAYQLLMQIEGTPCLQATVGKRNDLALESYFGGNAANLTYTAVEITPESKEKLGITQQPTIVSGKLRIECTKPGVAKITVRAIAGGDTTGTETQMGGIEIAKEFAVIARGVETENGGWL